MTKNEKVTYISGPISGVDGYMERFARTEEVLREAGLVTINPARLLKEYYEENGYDKTMERCLEMLDGCHAVFMMKGWEHSRGANTEWRYAVGNGLRVIYEEGLPREPPRAGAALMEDLRGLGGCFTDKCHNGNLGGAYHLYKKARVLYTWGRDRHLLEDGDGAELFGNRPYKANEEEERDGIFKQDLVARCEKEERDERTRLAKEQIRNLLERMKGMV